MVGPTLSDETLVKNVLHYGYYPYGDQTELPNGIREATTQPEFETDRDELVRRGIEALERSFDDLVSQTPDGATHVLPLSGGLDSRAILAALHNHPDVSPSQILTVTFGTPGTWDFEIGQRVANEVDVRNLTIDLTSSEFDWSLDALAEYVGDRRPNKFLEGYVNSQVPQHAPDDSVFWSGFMGDPSAGAHQPDQPVESWNAAREHFAEWNEEPDERLTPPAFDPTDILPDEPFLPREMLSYEEQLDFAVRQQYFIRPVVQPSPHEYLSPFLHDEWLSFAFRLPREHRLDRTLFKQMMREAYPDLFTLPTDARYGLPLSAPNWRMQLNRVGFHLVDRVTSWLGLQYVPPWTNYLDFETAFREEERFRTLVDNAVDGFESRDIADYLDVRELWQAHQAGADYAAELGIIVSLELYFRTR